MAEQSDREQVRENIHNGGWTVIWGKHINEVEYIQLAGAIAAGPGALAAYFEGLLTEMVTKFGENFAKEVISNFGIVLWHGNCQFSADIATYRYWQSVYNPIKARHEKLSLKPNTHQPYIKWRCLELSQTDTDQPYADPVTPDGVAFPRYETLEWIPSMMMSN